MGVQVPSPAPFNMNKTKVYAVCISYDYGVTSIYSTKELAQKYIDKEHAHQREEARLSYEDPESGWKKDGTLEHVTQEYFLTKYYIAEMTLDQDPVV